VRRQLHDCMHWQWTLWARPEQPDGHMLKGIGRGAMPETMRCRLLLTV
jgi:hypothetical protein